MRQPSVTPLLTLLFCLASGDLPVHCVHRDIIGKWQFRLAQNDGDASLTCGHHVPDRIMTMVKHFAGPANPPFQISRVLDVELRNPNVAVGPGGSIGTWTAVYDEGFEIILDGWRYLTFFRYTPKHAGADPSKSEDFHWLCYETVPGWYHPVERVPTGSLSHEREQRFVAAETGWGCFVGEQTARAVPSDASEAVAAARNLEQSVSGPAVLSATVRSLRFSRADEVVGAAASGAKAKEAALLQSQRRDAAGRTAARRAAAAAPPLVLADLASAARVTSHDVLEALHAADGAAAAELVLRINAEKGLWAARVPTELLGASREELRARLGASSSGKVRVPSHSRGAEAARKRHGDDAGSRREVRDVGNARGDVPLEALVGGHRPVIVDVSGLPAELDWATAEGGIYMPPVVDQRSCGSCYAVASIDAVTIRARIRSPALARSGFRLSPESVVRCSIFNQGCEGGYPYLVGKSAAEVGVIEESCMPYSGSQATCPRNVSCERSSAIQAWEDIVQGRSSTQSTGSAHLGRRLAANRESSMLEVATHAAAAATIPQSSIDADAVAASDKSDVFAGDAAADAALAAAFGGVGPLGLDASSPHFREGVPKVHEHAHSDAAMVENPFASATGRLRVSRYEYVGGYYGACHETSMLVELQKGPIVVAFNSPGTLYMYRSGIFTHSMAPDVTSVDVTPISRWEKTNHAVLLVGYGVEGGVKYWKLRNSWGTRFGEGGYFRMVRGVDMLACESMAVVIDV